MDISAVKNDGDSLSDALRDSLADDQPSQRDHQPHTVPVAEAKTAAPVRVTTSDRDNVRTLFVTTDTRYVEPGTAEQQHFADLAQFVTEVHIMVLRTGRGPIKVERPMPNVWLYHVSGRFQFSLLFAARAAAKQHLTFANVVRPDVVIALDPFVSALAAKKIARALKRPWQVHVPINPFNLEWLAAEKQHAQLMQIARKTLKRAPSVRTATDATAEAIRKRYPRCPDVAVLPRRYNLNAYERPVTADIHATYTQFNFIMLAEGPLRADSHLHDAIAATHQLLRSKHIGLVILGSGRAKQLFQEKTQLLGVAENIVFADQSVDHPLYYQTADVLIETSTDDAGDERVLRAIAARTPIVAYRNEFRDSFLTDGESALLSAPGDSFMLGQAVRRLLNDQTLRRQFARQAANISKDQIHEDLTAYFKAYRSSITTAIAKTADT